MVVQRLVGLHGGGEDGQAPRDAVPHSPYPQAGVGCLPHHVLAHPYPIGAVDANGGVVAVVDRGATNEAPGRVVKVVQKDEGVAGVGGGKVAPLAAVPKLLRVDLRRARRS